MMVSLVKSSVHISSSEYCILSSYRAADILRHVFEILSPVSLLSVKTGIRNWVSIQIKSVVEFETISGFLLSLDFFVRFFRVARQGSYFSFRVGFIRWMRGFLISSTFAARFLYLS